MTLADYSETFRFGLIRFLPAIYLTVNGKLIVL